MRIEEKYENSGVYKIQCPDAIVFIHLRPDILSTFVLKNIFINEEARKKNPI